MNANNSKAGENTSDTVSSRAKKKKKEKRREKKLKHKKSKKRKRKHRSSDSESENTRESKKLKKCKEKSSVRDVVSNVAEDENVEMPGPSVPRELLAEQAKSRAPMTKEEWEKSQSVIRRVYDESTGRTRFDRSLRNSLCFFLLTGSTRVKRNMYLYFQTSQR